MSNPNLFAIVQKDLGNLDPERLKRAFQPFSNLTDADAVRLGASARGILMRHLGMDAARALQASLQAEGVGVLAIPESALPKLSESRPLHRVSLSEDAFTIYDLLGHPVPILWKDVALLAAGAVRHFEMTRTQSDRPAFQFTSFSGIGPARVSEIGHRIQPEMQLLLEIVLQRDLTRFRIDAAQFPFNYLADSPAGTVAEKFVWIVREFSRRSVDAVLNCGARELSSGKDTVEVYPHRQAFADEMVWLLWRKTLR